MMHPPINYPIFNLCAVDLPMKDPIIGPSLLLLSGFRGCESQKSVLCPLNLPLGQLMGLVCPRLHDHACPLSVGSWFRNAGRVAEKYWALSESDWTLAEVSRLVFGLSRWER